MSPHPIVRGAVARAQQLVEELRDFRVFVGVTQLVDLVEYLEPAGERLAQLVPLVQATRVGVGRDKGADDFDTLDLALLLLEDCSWDAVDATRRADGLDLGVV